MADRQALERTLNRIQLQPEDYEMAVVALVREQDAHGASAATAPAPQLTQKSRVALAKLMAWRYAVAKLPESASNVLKGLSANDLRLVVNVDADPNFFLNLDELKTSFELPLVWLKPKSSSSTTLPESQKLSELLAAMEGQQLIFEHWNFLSINAKWVVSAWARETALNE